MRVMGSLTFGEEEIWSRTILQIAAATWRIETRSDSAFFQITLVLVIVVGDTNCECKILAQCVYAKCLVGVWSGNYCVEKEICARAAYEGLMDFVHQLESVPLELRHLRHVHFVDIDSDTTDAMASEMKSRRRTSGTGTRKGCQIQ